MLVPEPVIVVEVISPGTVHVDVGAKLIGYFTLASLRHYLIVDCDRKAIVHHARDGEGAIATQIVSDGTLALDPPGLELSLSEIFASA